MLLTSSLKIRNASFQQSKIEPTKLSVYDGRDLLGTVCACRGRFEAKSADGRLLGVFPTSAAAASALFRMGSAS